MGLILFLIKWKLVFEYCYNGIIFGYRVKYWWLDGVVWERVENIIVDILYVFFFDLDIFVNYIIGIVVFIRKGEGNVILDLVLLDNLGECLEKKE